MILRRLAAAVKRQDWFVVLIEFLIVVAGIFVGLQVNNWAEENAERAAEHAALERLFLEAQNAYAIVSIRLERAQRFNQTRRNAVAFLDSATPLPENTLPIKIGINALAQFPPVTFSSVAYDELTSSGQMQLIQSGEIRDLVSSFHVDIDRLNSLQEMFGDGGHEYWAAYRRNVFWRYNPDATGTDILLSTFDWDAMRQDRDFITIAIGALRNQIVIEDFLVSIVADAKAMCDQLGDAVERECSGEDGQRVDP